MCPVVSEEKFILIGKHFSLILLTVWNMWEPCDGDVFGQSES